MLDSSKEKSAIIINYNEQKKLNIKSLLSGILFIAGTSIGGGMLGIPYVTSALGFVPAAIITIIVWFFMLCTGFLFLEATLASKVGSNVFSITENTLGKKWKNFTGCTFIFLYYCFMVAYYSGISPVIVSFFNSNFGVHLTMWQALSLFLIIFGSIIILGLKIIDRVNFILMIGLILSFLLIVLHTKEHINMNLIKINNWKTMIFATPILFGAFGYHNIIPSVADYFKRDKKTLNYSVLIGTLIPLMVYLIWQFIIIGIIPSEMLLAASQKNTNIMELLKTITNNNYLSTIGLAFWCFAIITSFLGVSFSLIDFLADALKTQRVGKDRFLLCFLTFIPPFILVILKPSIFLIALGIAGGIGEAFINGLIPIFMVWALRYKKKHYNNPCLFGGYALLSLLTLMGLIVIFTEVYILFKNIFK